MHSLLFSNMYYMLIHNKALCTDKAKVATGLSGNMMEPGCKQDATKANSLCVSRGAGHCDCIVGWSRAMSLAVVTLYLLATI